MKTKNTLYKIAFLFFGLGCFTLQACKKPSDGVEVTVNTDIYTSPMMFRFANANVSATNQPGDFDVTVTGADAALVTTNEGRKTFKARGGLLTLVLPKTAAPSPLHPVNFSLIATVDGFTPVVQNITIISDSVYSQEINLVEYAKPADGTSALVQSTTLTAGVSGAATTTLTTPATATTTETAKVSIPAGTKFFAENGTQITSGNLESKIVYYGTGTEASMNAFPGGFNANNIIGENGQPIAGGATFITAGFLAVNMKVGNTVVKSFSTPLPVTMQIRNTLINPNTGTTVKVGDIIPIWSLDEKTGQWKFETNATVTTSGGQLSLTYTMAHLSYWNVDWPYYTGLGFNCNRSANPLRVFIKISDTTAFTGKVYLATSTGQQLTNYAGGYTTIKHNDTIGFTGNIPNIAGVKVVVTNLRGVKIAESPGFNPCSSGDITLNVPGTSVAIPTSRVYMYLKAKCSNKSITANVSASANIYIYDGSQYRYYMPVYVNNGFASFVLENNQKYKVETYYGITKYAAFIDYKSANFSFAQASTNASITGTAIYNKDKNIYFTTANISVPCN
jgi:hypothetical protein